MSFKTDKPLGWELRIPTEIINTNEYLSFCGTKAFALYNVMYTHIVRNTFEFWPLGVDIYNKYYRNGYLACRWGQIYLAEKLNTDQAKISRMVKELTNKKIIKVDKIVYKRSINNIYILGTHDFDNIEKLYFIQEFKKQVEKVAVVGCQDSLQYVEKT